MRDLIKNYVKRHLLDFGLDGMEVTDSLADTIIEVIKLDNLTLANAATKVLSEISSK